MTNNNDNSAVPYFVYEGEQARNERTIKRLVIVLIVAVALIFASNMAWLIAWNQYDYLSVDIENSNGNANYIGNDGDIINGTDPSSQTDTQEWKLEGNPKEET